MHLQKSTFVNFTLFAEVKHCLEKTKTMEKIRVMVSFL